MVPEGSFWTLQAICNYLVHINNHQANLDDDIVKQYDKKMKSTYVCVYSKYVINYAKRQF